MSELPEEVKHKLVLVAANSFKEGYLHDLVLCWNYMGTPAPDQIQNTRVVTSINDSTCFDCRRIWAQHGGAIITINSPTIL